MPIIHRITALCIALALLAPPPTATAAPPMPAAAIVIPSGARLTVEPPAGTVQVCVIVPTPATAPPCQPPGQTMEISGAAGGTAIAVYALDAALEVIGEARVVVQWGTYLPLVQETAQAPLAH